MQKSDEDARYEQDRCVSGSLTIRQRLISQQMDRELSMVKLRRLVVILGPVLGLTVLGLIILSMTLGWWAGRGRRSITELTERVFYSPANSWLTFYRTRAPAGTGWVHLPDVNEAAAYRSEIDPALRGYLPPSVCA